MFFKPNNRKRNSNSGQRLKSLAEHSFLLTIILFLIAAGIACLIYYKYVYVAMNAEPVATTSNIKIKEDAFWRIVDSWNKREDQLNNLGFKQYKTPFLAGN